MSGLVPSSDAAPAALLVVPVVLPIVGAVLAPLTAPFNRVLPLVTSILAVSASGLVLLLIARRVYGPHTRVLVHYFGHWKPIGGQALGISFAADPFGLTFALMSASIGTCLLLAAFSELGRLGNRELGGFACLFQVLIAALIGAALTSDLINLFVWFQVASLASYGLSGFFLERPIALEATFKLIVMTTIAGFSVFIGAAMLYAQHGALNFGQLRGSLARGLRTADLIALGLLVTGFATKAGLVPWHGWLPDAHTPAPGSVSALFSGLMVNLGVVAVVRVCLQLFPGTATRHHMTGMLLVAGVASAFLGGILALAQDDLKRVLAWDTISQMGILIIGFATANAHSVAGSVYHMISHGVFKALLFLCAGGVVHTTGLTKMSEMGGLLRHRTSLAIGFTIGTAAIAGIPPLSGYASVGLIHEGVKDSNSVVYAAVLIAQVITVAALGRAAYLTFYRKRAQPYQELEKPRTGMRVALGLLAAACLAIGIFPRELIDTVAAPAAASLLNRDGYAHAVLSSGGTLPHLAVHFHYWLASELLTIAATVAAGLLLAAWYVRRDEPRAVTALRRLHTGLVNDYATYAAAGTAACLLILIS
jgi:multicomponent Na+:H+ antiporter subunit D